MFETLEKLLEEIEKGRSLYKFILEDTDGNLKETSFFNYEDSEYLTLGIEDEPNITFDLRQLAEASHYENAIVALDENGNRWNLIPLMKLTMSQVFG